MRRLLLLVFFIGCAVSPLRESALTEAVRSGDVATVRTMCAQGADPNAPVGGNGWPPLLHAVHKNQLATAAALLDGGADVDRPDPRGMTALMMAAGYGNREMVALLLRHGASARVADHGGEAAIDYALAGMTDIDDFTFFRCQNETTALLRSVSPAPRASSRRWASIKGCV